MGPRAATVALVLLGLLAFCACAAPSSPPAAESPPHEEESAPAVQPAAESLATRERTRGQERPAPEAHTVAPQPAGDVARPQASSPSGKRICLDPGHDANSPGASARDAAGRTIFNEHDLTLAVAYRLKALLEAEGFVVCVTRDAEGWPVAVPRDESGDGRLQGWERAQAKVDYVNAFGARVFVSIHFNGISDPSVRGSEVYYPDTGPYEENNRRLAATLLQSLLAAMREAGYGATDRGIKSDNYKPYGRLWILGYNDQLARKARWQAGALVEVLFLTNPADVSFLQRPDALDVIARGLRDGIVRFWQETFPADRPQ